MYILYMYVSVNSINLEGCVQYYSKKVGIDSSLRSNQTFRQIVVKLVFFFLYERVNFANRRACRLAVEMIFIQVSLCMRRRCRFKVSLDTPTSVYYVQTLLILLENCFQEQGVKLREQLKTEGAPKFLAICEKLLKNNNGGDGWFVGNDVSILEVSVFHMNANVHVCRIKTCLFMQYIYI